MTDIESTLPDIQTQEILKKWYERFFEFFENPFASAGAGSHCLLRHELPDLINRA